MSSENLGSLHLIDPSSFLPACCCDIFFFPMNILKLVPSGNEFDPGIITLYSDSNWSLIQSRVETTIREQHIYMNMMLARVEEF